MDNGASSYRRFLDGDDDGIVQIVEEYKDCLIFFINSFVCNIHTAEELTEDTFFRLMSKKPRFDGKYNFKTWLFTIGRNIALDYLRHNSKAKNAVSIEAVTIQSEEEDFEEAYIMQRQKITLHKAMKKLKKEHRQVLQLIYFEDFTNEQTAKVMKKTKRQIESLSYRAKKALKAQLEKEEFVYEDF